MSKLYSYAITAIFDTSKNLEHIILTESDVKDGSSKKLTDIPEVWTLQETIHFNGENHQLNHTLINSKTGVTINFSQEDSDVLIWIVKRLNVAELFIPDKEIK